MIIEGYLHPSSTIDIICPKCGKRAAFQRSHTIHQRKTSPTYCDNIWQFADQNIGTCQCDHCVSRFEHCLQWPDDAYWRTSVRGLDLWAHSRPEVEMLVEFVGSSHRDISRFPAYTYFLRHFPRALLSSKLRDEVVKKLNRLLEQYSP